MSPEDKELIIDALDLAHAELHHRIATCPDVFECATEIEELKSDQAKLMEIKSRLKAARQAPASGEVEPVAYISECPGSSILFFEKERAEKYSTMHRGETKALTYARAISDHPPAKVPAEPTEEMLEAAMSERDKQHPANAKRYLRYVWERMLSAMPTPATTAQPAQQGSVPEEIHNHIAGLRGILWSSDWRSSQSRQEMSEITTSIERLALSATPHHRSSEQ